VKLLLVIRKRQLLDALVGHRDQVVGPQRAQHPLVVEKMAAAGRHIGGFLLPPTLSSAEPTCALA
jgi:hypothetical protein